MDLDLEADLGVDTVKQAETFAAVREAYGIARQENLKLRDFPTLKHVVGVRLPVPAGPEAGGAVAAEPVSPGPGRVGVPSGLAAPAGPERSAGGARILRRRGQRGAPQDDKANPVVQKVLADRRREDRLPEDMLEMDLDLEADLGVDTVKQAETFAAVREAYGIARQENLKLRDFPTLKHVVEFVYEFRPDLKPAAVAATPGMPTDSGPEGSRGTADPRRPAGSKLLGMTRVRPRLLRMTGAAVGVPRVLATIEDADKMPRRVPVPSLRPAARPAASRPASSLEQGRARRRRRRRGRRRRGPRGVPCEKRGVAVLALDGATRRPRTSRAASPGG